MIDDRKTLTCYDLRTGKSIGQPVSSELYRHSVAVSPDGLSLAISSSRGNSVFSFIDGSEQKLDPRELTPPNGRPDSSMAVRFMNPHRLLFAGKPHIFIYDLKTDKSVYLDIPQALDRITTTSHGGRYIATVDEKQGLTIRDVDHDLKSVFQQAFTGRPDFVSASFSPNGKELAILVREVQTYSIHLLDLTTKKMTSWPIVTKEDIPMSFGIECFNPWSELQWLTGDSGWLIRGEVLVPRDPKRAAVLLSMESRQPDMIRILDTKRALVPIGVARGLSLVCRDMPLENVSAIADAISSGGSVADVLLPPIVEAKDTPNCRDLGYLVPQNTYSYQPSKVHTSSPDYVEFIPQRRGDAFQVENVWFGDPQCVRGVVETQEITKKFAGFPKPTCLGGVYYDTYDLATGANLSQFELTYPARMLSVSPDGMLAAMLLTGIDREDRIDIWSLADSKHIVGFKPNADGKTAPRKVHAATFIDNDNLIVQQGNIVSLWRVPECEKTYMVGADTLRPTVSPDRSIMLLQSQQRLILIDPLDGKMLGTLAQPDIVLQLDVKQALFSPSGQQLAILCSPELEELSYVCIWDLATGKLTNQIPMPFSGTSIAWAKDDNLLVTDKVGRKEENVHTSFGVRTAVIAQAKDRLSLVGIKSGVVLWSYSFPDGGYIAPHSHSNHIFYARRGDSGVKTMLVSAKLPDAKTVAAIAQGDTGPLKSIVSPGAAWKLQIDTQQMPALLDPDKMHDLLKKELTSALIRNGMSVTESRPDLTLDVKFESVDTQHRFSYRVLGRGFMTDSVPDELVRCKVEVLGTDGKPIWSREKSAKTSTSGHFGLESIPQDEQVGEYIKKRPWKMVFSWLTASGVPRFIFPENADSGLGETELRSSGPVTVRSP